MPSLSFVTTVIVTQCVILVNNKKSDGGYNMDELILQLKQLGLTEYEAKAYIALVQESPASAAQISKLSTVPRARVYGILDALVEKGVVLKENAEKTTMYRALPVALFIEKAQQDFTKTIEQMDEQLTALEAESIEQQTQILSLQEKESIMQYCRHLLEKAEQTIMISMWEDMYALLREDIERAAARVDVKGITIRANNVLPTIDTHRTTHHLTTTQNPHWFIIAVDHKEALYGSPVTERFSAFLTDDEMHLYILEDYIWHDVLVNRLVKRNGDDSLEEWVKKERANFFNK